jgi:hypothetical protein
MIAYGRNSPSTTTKSITVPVDIGRAVVECALGCDGGPGGCGGGPGGCGGGPGGCGGAGGGGGDGGGAGFTAPDVAS